MFSQTKLRYVKLLFILAKFCWVRQIQIFISIGLSSSNSAPNLKWLFSSELQIVFLITVLSLFVEIRPNSSWICRTPIYVIAARVDGMLCPLAWLSGIGVPGSSTWVRPGGVEFDNYPVEIAEINHPRDPEYISWLFLKPLDQLHRFWFENLADISTH